MKEKLIGGQIIYPLLDENWELDAKTNSLVLDEIKMQSSFQ